MSAVQRMTKGNKPSFFKNITENGKKKSLHLTLVDTVVRCNLSNISQNYSYMFDEFGLNGFNDGAEQSTACSHFINNIIILLFSSNCSTICGKENAEHWSWNTNKYICHWKQLHKYPQNGIHFWEFDLLLHFYLTLTTQHAHLSLFFTFDVKQKVASFQSVWAMYVCAVRSVQARLDLCECRVKKEGTQERICVQRNKGSLVFEALREGMPSPCPVKYTGLSFWCPQPL